MEMSAVLVYILLKTNIHPNHVTLVYGFSGLLAGFLISLGKSEFIMVGIFIFFTRGILDWTDGHLARKTGKTSLTGHVLDEYGALLGSVGLGFGLGFFVAQRTDYEFLYYLVFSFPVLRLLMIHNYAKSVLVRKLFLQITLIQKYLMIQVVLKKRKSHHFFLIFKNLSKVFG